MMARLCLCPVDDIDLDRPKLNAVWMCYVRYILLIFNKSDGLKG